MKMKFLILFLVIFFCVKLIKCSRNNGQVRNNGLLKYDYIIVGGGTAGCVLANRLTENPENKVLLLEAGMSDLGNPLSEFIKIPLMFPTLQNTMLDWQFKTEEQAFAAKEVKDKKTLWPQGKVLGGSSSINALKVSRGSPHDYNLWRDLGNVGWGYDDVLPYFKKLEDVQDRALYDQDYRGRNGPIPVVKTNVSKLSDIFVRAGREMGYMDIDQNAATQKGFGYIQHNTKNGRRVNTAEAYLRPVMNRDNLHVKTSSHVTKIKTKNNVAVGVYYTDLTRQQDHYAKATREVIVSAGAIMSPFILLHSGIGPSEHLRRLGMKVVADLPVGKRLQDHVFTYVNFFMNESTLSSCPSNTNTFNSLFQFMLMGKGHWSTSGTQGSAYMATEAQPRNSGFPYLELFMTSCMPGATNDTATMWKALTGSTDEMYDPFHQDERGREGFMLFPVLLHPRTTGTVEIRDRDPFSKPKITMNYLEHPDDVKDLIEGIRKTQQLIQTKPFRKIGAMTADGVHPGCTEHFYDSDAYWECYVRHKSFSGYHYSSSCEMGRITSPNTVVDQRLRVKNVRNLRVVDASIMPHVISGNTMVPVIMIAEKAADMIKEDNPVLNRSREVGMQPAGKPRQSRTPVLSRRSRH